MKKFAMNPVLFNQEFSCNFTNNLNYLDTIPECKIVKEVHKFVESLILQKASPLHPSEIMFPSNFPHPPKVSLEFREMLWGFKNLPFIFCGKMSFFLRAVFPPLMFAKDKDVWLGNARMSRATFAFIGNTPSKKINLFNPFTKKLVENRLFLDKGHMLVSQYQGLNFPQKPYFSMPPWKNLTCLSPQIPLLQTRDKDLLKSVQKPSVSKLLFQEYKEFYYSKPSRDLPASGRKIFGYSPNEAWFHLSANSYVLIVSAPGKLRIKARLTPLAGEDRWILHAIAHGHFQNLPFSQIDIPSMIPFHKLQIPYPRLSENRPDLHIAKVSFVDQARVDKTEIPQEMKSAVITQNTWEFESMLRSEQPWRQRSLHPYFLNPRKYFDVKKSTPIEILFEHLQNIGNHLRNNVLTFKTAKVSRSSLLFSRTYTKFQTSAKMEKPIFKLKLLIFAFSMKMDVNRRITMIISRSKIKDLLDIAERARILVRKYSTKGPQGA